MDSRELGDVAQYMERILSLYHYLDIYGISTLQFLYGENNTDFRYSELGCSI